jgi:superfamily II DNA/RNA helicase
VGDSLQALNFAKTIAIDPEVQTEVSNMKFSLESKKVLTNDKGFKVMTPVQSQSFDLILSGVDVVARSLTGTGKTIAFGLPVIEQIASVRRAGDKGAVGPRYLCRLYRVYSSDGPRCLICFFLDCVRLSSVLILEPTRELAIQVLL